LDDEGEGDDIGGAAASEEEAPGAVRGAVVAGGAF
jgi:hypothetical protein